MGGAEMYTPAPRKATLIWGRTAKMASPTCHKMGTHPKPGTLLITSPHVPTSSLFWGTPALGTLPGTGSAGGMGDAEFGPKYGDFWDTTHQWGRGTARSHHGSGVSLSPPGSLPLVTERVCLLLPAPQHPTLPVPHLPWLSPQKLITWLFKGKRFTAYR